MAKKAARKRKARKSSDNGANLGFEAKLWLAADKLRNNLDAAEYKHVVLGLIFLKYISDAFEEMHTRLVKGEGEYEAPGDVAHAGRAVEGGGRPSLPVLRERSPRRAARRGRPR